MSDYKLFISYVYEYQGNHKGSNRGFVKVECRGGVCQINLSLRGLCRDGNGICKIYGFRRAASGLRGSLLCSLDIRGGTINHNLQFSETEIGQDKYSLQELSGLIVLWENNVYYATQWDDEPLNFQGFSKVKVPIIPKVSPSDSGQTDTKAPAPKEEESIPEEIPSAQQESDDLPDSPPPDEDQVQATSTDAKAPKCCPYFKDGFITNCVKITPADICRLNSCDWHLSNNRFVHYGFQAFGHLLVGQLTDSGQTVLCVPGTYHQQECFMANMFGFSNFKHCPGQKDCPRCFGYWYRSIHPTDINKGNGNP